jgi:phenylacetate-CoA ligase
VNPSAGVSSTSQVSERLLATLAAVPQDILTRTQVDVERLQLELLNLTLAMSRSAHPYYRERDDWPAVELTSLADLSQIPVTTKTEFLAAPEQFRMRPLGGFPIEADVLREVMYTTGTTSGVPAPIYTTAWDYVLYQRQAARVAGLLRLSSRDVIANVFPFTAFPSGGYVRAMATAAAVGAAIIPVHTGRSPDMNPDATRSLDQAIELIVSHEATVIWGVSSFVQRLLERAVAAGVMLPALRMCWVTGEATSGRQRERMSANLALLGTDAYIINRYGSTEGTTLVECAAGAGWHHPAPDQVLFETVDEHTMQPVTGEPGLLLLTTLARTGTAFLRYAVGDVVRLETEPCSCGLTSQRVVSVPQRTGDVIKIKGTLVSRAALVAAVEAASVDDYQLVLVKPAVDEPIAKLVVRLGATDATRSSELIAVVTDAIQKVGHIRPVVEFVPRDDLFDPHADVKAVRFIEEIELSD